MVNGQSAINLFKWLKSHVITIHVDIIVYITMPCYSLEFSSLKLFSFKVKVLQGTHCVFLVFLTFMLDAKFGKSNYQDTKVCKRFRYTCFNRGFENYPLFKRKNSMILMCHLLIFFTNYFYSYNVNISNIESMVLEMQ